MNHVALWQHILFFICTAVMVISMAALLRALWRSRALHQDKLIWVLLPFVILVLMLLPAGFRLWHPHQAKPHVQLPPFLQTAPVRDGHGRLL